MLSVMVVAYIALLGATYAQTAYQRELRAQKSELEREIAGYRRYDLLRLQVERAEMIIRKAVRPAPAWSPILAGLGSRIPEGAWLEGFQAVLRADAVSRQSIGVSSPAPGGEQQENISGAPENAPAVEEAGSPRQQSPDAGTPTGEVRQVTITGWAFNHLLVADWLQSLEQDPDLENVDCRYSSEKDYSGRPLIQFEINALIRPSKSGPQGEAKAT